MGIGATQQHIKWEREKIMQVGKAHAPAATAENWCGAATNRATEQCKRTGCMQQATVCKAERGGKQGRCAGREGNKLSG